MKHDVKSRTAQGVAAARAVEQARPARERILDDPYAADFSEGLLGVATRNKLLARLTERLFEIVLPGMVGFVNVRGRYSDELVARSVRDGARQFLLLGAGFDTASLRLGTTMKDLVLFEVDHPATQAAKRATVERIAPDLARRIRFVAVDFERDDLVERLTASGFDPALPSVATWMGVSYYLTEDAIAGTLAKLARLLSPGSHLALDIATRATIAGTTGNRAADFGTRKAANLGEPFVFGRDPDEVEALVEPFGFDVVEVLTPTELVRRYTNAHRRTIDFAYIVTLVRSARG
jgi:methyltransferase (TIGR00027 family)